MALIERRTANLAKTNIEVSFKKICIKPKNIYVYFKNYSEMYTTNRHFFEEMLLMECYFQETFMIKN